VLEQRDLGDFCRIVEEYAAWTACSGEADAPADPPGPAPLPLLLLPQPASATRAAALVATTMTLRLLTIARTSRPARPH
jgi:hypothetical protein